MTSEALATDPAELMRQLQTMDGRRSPHALLSRLREVAPVYREEASGFWYLLRWEDCNRVLRSDAFGQSGRVQLDPRYAGSDALQLISENVSFKDPPEHTRLRAFAQKAFTGPAVAKLRGYLEGLIHQVLDGLAERREFDVVGDYSGRIPSTVICEMLGVPREDHAKFDVWLADQFRLLTPNPPSDELLAEVDASTRDLRSYIIALIEERRRAPRDDLISRFAAVAEDPPANPVSLRELVAMTVVLLAGGSDTTRFVIAMAMRALIQDPDQAQWLREDPTRDARAFEEFLRLYGPIIMGNLRKALAEFHIGEHTVRPGDSVVPVLLSANLDPAVFQEPHRLLLSRHPNPHMAFGGGIHSCLGMMLARLVGPHAIGLMARRFTRLELVDQTLDINPNLFALRGLKTLRVRRA